MLVALRHPVEAAASKVAYRKGTYGEPPAPRDRYDLDPMKVLESDKWVPPPSRPLRSSLRDVVLCVGGHHPPVTDQLRRAFEDEAIAQFTRSCPTRTDSNVNHHDNISLYTKAPLDELVPRKDWNVWEVRCGRHHGHGRQGHSRLVSQ